MSERKLKDIDDLKKHLTKAKKNSDRSEEGRAHGNLGNAYESLDKFQLAIEYHTEHLSVAKEVGDRGGGGEDVLMPISAMLMTP